MMVSSSTVPFTDFNELVWDDFIYAWMLLLVKMIATENFQDEPRYSFRRNLPAALPATRLFTRVPVLPFLTAFTSPSSLASVYKKDLKLISVTSAFALPS